MDKNRKIMAAILFFLTVSVALSVVNINISMNRKSAAVSNIISVSGGPGVGIVRITGMISSTGNQSAFGGIPSSEQTISRLNDLMNDDRIKAVVLRIDSPGGTVAATQEIFKKIRQLQMKKPVVASMGDLAASGGYYVASGCTRIVANQGTLTGSIGVIIAAPNMKGLFEKLGIKMNVIKSGKYKDILSSSRDLSDEERDLIQVLIDSCYKQFVKDVALGRNLPIDDVKKYADGRIFNGETALGYHLVDELGGFEDSIARARELAKLPDDAPVYEEVNNPFEKLFGKVESTFSGPALALPGEGGLVEYRYQP